VVGKYLWNIEAFSILISENLPLFFLQVDCVRENISFNIFCTEINDSLATKSISAQMGYLQSNSPLNFSEGRDITTNAKEYQNFSSRLLNPCDMGCQVEDIHFK